MALGLSEASLISILMESVLFGFFTILFLISIYILFLKRRKSQPLNKAILAVSISMYSLAIMHLAVDMRRAINGFIRFKDRPGGSDAYFNALSDPLYIYKSTIYTAQTLLGDGFVIYRSYIVWSGDKRLVVPALVCLTGSIITGVGALVSFSKVSPTTLVFISDLKHWITSFFAITLFTNLSCTALIALRIWWVEHQTSGALHSRSLSPVMTIVVESGAIYSASLISLLSTYLSGSWGQYPVLDSTTQIIGVVFSLIIVRIGLGITFDETTRHATTNGTSHQLHKIPIRPVVAQALHGGFAREGDGRTLPGSLGFVASNTTISVEMKFGQDGFEAQSVA